MMKYIYRIAFLTIISATLLSCVHKTKTGNDLSTEDINHIKSLGILLNDEKIIRFDTQTDIKSSGNFFTDKRLASYWIDKRDKSNNSFESAFYEEIDSIKPHDLTRSLTYASYIKVTTSNAKTFNIYVDGDSTQVWTFFNGAIDTWKSAKRN